MQRDGIVTVYADEKRKTIYEVSDIGKALMRHEMTRLKELYANVMQHEEEFK